MKLLTHNLSKQFGGVTAVNHVNLEFCPGTITGIIGPNGSGKTTLTNLLTGVLKPNSGTIIIGEHLSFNVIEPTKIIDFGIVRTFQEVRIFEHMSVIDNVRVIMTKRNPIEALLERNTDIYDEIICEALKQVKLYEKRELEVCELSYGQRKLLEIARILVTKADIVIFDEPFAGLFPEMIAMVEKVMETLKLQGKTVILIEHNMNLIRKLTDYVYVLDSGSILAQGKPNETLNLPSVKEAYLGE
jgi:branched-chain amino acid transport system ATP-binding protein